MFSIKRFFEQFKIIWMQNSQKVFLNIGILTLIIIFINFMIFNQFIDKFSFGLGGVIIAFMTYISSANVFSSLQQTSSGIHYFMTPATITEKYAAAWFYSSFFTIFVYSITVFLIYIFSISVGNLFTDFHLSLNLPNTELLWSGLLGILFYHSFFFLGATVFKKNPFLKTLLCIILFLMVLGVITKITMVWFIGGIEGMNSYQWNLEINDFSDFDKLSKSFDLETYENIAKMTLTSIPVIFWVIAYFKLKTRQI